MGDITDWNDLDSIRDSNDTTFTLTQDLDSNTAGYDSVASSSANGGSGWNPIDSFDGTLDGNEYTISDLVINRPDSNVALILSASGEITNLTLNNVDITGEEASGLVRKGSPKITNCSVTGDISGTRDIGGLIGEGQSGTTINNSTTDVTIEGGLKEAASYNTGGLIGILKENEGETSSVTGSSATGDITGGRSIGGLIGSAKATVEDCHAEVEITANPSSSLTNSGGLIGYARETATVKNSYATGTVTGPDNLGGLIGTTDGSTEITDCRAEGDVVGKKESDHVGGLVGSGAEKLTIKRSHATGKITGGSRLGGLIGGSGGTINDCYAEGKVESNSGDGDYVGGLVGQFEGEPLPTVEASHATGNVFGGKRVGGLFGEATATITNCYAEGDVTGSKEDKQYIGGFVGEFVPPFLADGTPTINSSYSTGNVSGKDRVGGFTGKTESEITESFSRGNVSGSERTGGFVGEVDGGTVTDCYTLSNVTASNAEDDTIGGVAGVVAGQLTQCYAAGAINTSADARGVGKNSFFADGTPIKDAYWSKNRAGINTDGPGEKLTSSQMTGDSASNNMDSLDFTSTWQETIGDNSDSTPLDGFPILQGIDASVQRVDAIFLQPPDAPTGLTAIPV